MTVLNMLLAWARWKIGLPVLGLVILLGACGGGKVVSPTDSSEAVRDCGVERTRPGTDVSEASIDCVWSAYQAGEDAKLVVIGLTNEGDEIPVTLVASPAGRTELSRDVRGDRFSAPADRIVWSYSCRTLARRAGVNATAYFFELSDCTGAGGQTHFP